MKLHKTSLIAVALCSTLFAKQMYYGGGIGIGQNSSSHTGSNAITVGSNSNGGSNSSHLGGTSFQGFGFAGVSGKLTHHLRGSVQLDLGYDGLNKTLLNHNAIHNISGDTSVASGSVGLKTGFYYGASGRLSMVRGDYSTYLLAGVRAGQWKVIGSYANTNYPTLDIVSGAANASFSKTIVAPELGVGVNVTYTDSLDGRLEWKYFFGGSMSKTGVVVGDNASMAYSDKINVRQQSVQFSVVF